MVGPHIPPQQFTHQNRAKSDLGYVLSECAVRVEGNVFRFRVLPNKVIFDTIKKKKKKKKKKGLFFFF